MKRFASVLVLVLLAGCASQGTQTRAAAARGERTAIVESGGIRIGVFGVTIPVQGVAYVERFDDPVETARQLTADLRAQGAEIVVALTHLNAKDDRRLLETLGDAGPDLIIGGHEHEKMVLDEAGRKRASRRWRAAPRTAAISRRSW